MVENESELFTKIRATCKQYVESDDKKSLEAAERLKPLLIRANMESGYTKLLGELHGQRHEYLEQKRDLVHDNMLANYNGRNRNV